MIADARPRPPANAGSWTRGCAAAKATGGYSYSQLRQAYGIDKLGARTRRSVAVLNDAEGFAQADLDRFDRCFGAPAHRTRTLLTDGQAAPFPIGSFEPLEDLALVRGIGPQLRSVLFTQVSGTPGLWFLGAAKLLALPRRLGVAWPASSTFVTAVGGTRLVLNKANERVREVAWNDLRWLSPATAAAPAEVGSRPSTHGRPTSRGSRSAGAAERCPTSPRESMRSRRQPRET